MNTGAMPRRRSLQDRRATRNVIVGESAGFEVHNQAVSRNSLASGGCPVIRFAAQTLFLMTVGQTAAKIPVAKAE